MIDKEKESELVESPSRRSFLEAGSAALAAATFVGLTANAQQRDDTREAESDHSTSDPGQENKPLLAENPNTNTPPPTDHGDIGPIWYSFDLARNRVQEGGWAHQVTQRELPPSTELAGVNMRLTRGSFRELHWHTADEWAIMLTGNARVTVLNPDGTIFIDDVTKGDLWFFPAGYPHSIQGLGPGDGCEFLLVFDEGMFSEDNTFLISAWVAHTPPEILTKNSNLDRSAIARLPKDELYIFPANLPGSLAAGQGSRWREECSVFHPIHLQDVGDGPHSENSRRRSPYRRLAQFPGLEEHRRRTGHAQARRYARDALASKCLRVAVLPRR